MTTVAAPAPAEPTTPGTPATSQRLMSVDALRGFDMFWIIGAGSLVYALNRMSKTGWIGFLANQLEHADWEGFRFYDLIFPLFVFIVGVSIVFSLTKAIEQGSRADALKRVLRRAALLFLVALFYSGGVSREWPDIRLLGVLNRIALCYFSAALIFLYCRPRTIIAVCAGLLLGYWAIMALVPIRNIRLEQKALARMAEAQGDAPLADLIRKTENPSTTKNSPVMEFARARYFATTDRVTGKFDPGYNLSNHLDFLCLPGKKWDSFWDPEGYLGPDPAVATCLLGVFGGLLLRNRNVPDQQKVWWLIGAGAAAIVLGWLWGVKFPVIKKIWTSSYVLVAGGWSAVLLGAFFQVVDIWKWQRWCQPFVWIGANSITIYLAASIIGFARLGQRLVGGDIKTFFDEHVAKGFGELMISVVGLLLAFWFVHFLYKRKIFLRL